MKKIGAIKISQTKQENRLHFALKLSAANKCYVISDTDGNIVIKGKLEKSEQHKIAISELKTGNYFIHIIDGEKLFFEQFELL